MSLNALLDMLKSDWLPKLVEPRSSKNVGSNEPWDIGLLWEPVLYWYLLTICSSFDFPLE